MKRFFFTILLGSLFVLCGNADADRASAMKSFKDGQALVAAGEFAKAVPVFERMLSQCESLGDCRATATFYIGRCKLEIGDNLGADQYLAEAERQYGALRDNLGLGVTLLLRGRIFSNTGRYQEAFPLFNRAEETLASLRNYDELANVHTAKALAFFHLSKFNESLAEVEKSANALRNSKSPSRELLAQNENVRAMVFTSTQHYAEATEKFNNALREFEALGSKRGVAEVTNSLGQVYEAQSEFDKALELYTRSYDTARAIQYARMESLALSNRGNVYLRRGAYDQAAKDYGEAYSQAKRLNDKLREANMLNKLGVLYYYTGDFRRAESHYAEAINLAARVQSVEEQAWPTMNMATLIKEKGEFPRSMDLFDQALGVAKKLGNRRLEANVLLRRANLWEYLGADTSAQEDYTRAADIQHSINDFLFESNTRADLALMQTREKKIREAAVNLNLASRLKRERKLPLTDFSARYALFYLEKHQYEGQDSAQPQADLMAAREQIRIAEQGLKGLSDSDLMIVTYAKGRMALLEAGFQPEEKRPQYWLDAQRQFTTLAGVAETMGNKRFGFLAQANLGLTHEAAGQFADAERAYKKAIDYAEYIRGSIDAAKRRHFLNAEAILGVKHMLPYEGLARVQLKLAKNEDAFMTADLTKARSFSENIVKGVKESDFGIPKDILARLDDVELRRRKKREQLELQIGAKSLQRDRDRVVAELDQIDKDYQSIDNVLRRDYPKFRLARKPEELKIKDARIENFERIISFDVTDTGVLVFVNHGKDLVYSKFVEIPRKKLTKMVSEFLYPLNLDQLDGAAQMRRLKSFDFKTGHELAKLLLSDALRFIPEGSAITIIPDDELGVLPFEALPLNSGGRMVEGEKAPKPVDVKFLADHCDVTVNHSVQAITLVRAFRAAAADSNKLLIMADPVYSLKAQEDPRGPGLKTMLGQKKTKQAGELKLMAAMDDEDENVTWPRLPLTKNLADELKLLFVESEIHTGADASLSTFKKLAPGLNKFGGIVFATHGDFSPDKPLGPALVLSVEEGERPGKLTMDEIMSLKLNAQIVALTACKSGLGKSISGEGTMGMGYAFQYAGAKTVLMSLWAVAEDTSVTLTETMFKELKRGEPKVKAFANARKKIRADGYEHPFFWAAFVMAGEGF